MKIGAVGGELGMKDIFLCGGGDLRVVGIGGVKNAILIMQGLENAIFWYRMVLKYHFLVYGVSRMHFWVWWGVKFSFMQGVKLNCFLQQKNHFCIGVNILAILILEGHILTIFVPILTIQGPFNGNVPGRVPNQYFYQGKNPSTALNSA